MSVDVVRDAYDRRADEYTDLFCSLEAMDERDRAFVSRWADALSGPVVDAGCGPGQWTDFLRRRGCDVEGVDLVPRFVDIARSRFPDSSYRVGELHDLGVADHSLAGILAWYSLIHTAPEDVPRVLAEFARCVRPDGGLVLGLFTGDRLEPFAHAVTTAHFWPLEDMTRLLAHAGFRVETTESRVEPGKRPYLAIAARRAPA
ncbi:class I SAM-dependent methyltransferase [Actinosynnema sp. NPDC020468]|uniref:class I SAM-dependent DNA methyltransferase n=1 Tax=Actinosynnema sp. NPDC020468 TaxID=3154488 RepID=UPI00340F58CE